MKIRTATLSAALVLAAQGCDKPAEPTATPPDATPTAEGGEVPDTPAADDGEVPGAEGGDPEGGDDGEADSGGGTAAILPGDPVPVPDDPQAGLTKATSFADVKLEIKATDGKVHRDAGKVIRWDELTRIPIDFQGIEHEFLIEVGQSGKTAKLTITYNAGGEEVLRKFKLDATTKKREVIRIDDGSALAVTVTPKTIKPKPASKDKVKPSKGDNPLDGAKKGK